MSRWVTDASPLIFLAKLDLLRLLRSSAEEVLVPRVVVDEIRVHADTATRRVDFGIGEWLTLRDHSPGTLPDFVRREAGPGEAAAMALALETDAERIVLDDLDARRWARRLGLRPIGTLGVLLAARLRRDIPSVALPVARLQDMGFRASERLVDAILREAGED